MLTLTQMKCKSTPQDPFKSITTRDQCKSIKQGPDLKIWGTVSIFCFGHSWQLPFCLMSRAHERVPRGRTNGSSEWGGRRPVKAQRCLQKRPDKTTRGEAACGNQACTTAGPSTGPLNCVKARAGSAISSVTTIANSKSPAENTVTN